MNKSVECLRRLCGLEHVVVVFNSLTILVKILHILNDSDDVVMSIFVEGFGVLIIREDDNLQKINSVERSGLKFSISNYLWAFDWRPVWHWRSDNLDPPTQRLVQGRIEHHRNSLLVSRFALELRKIDEHWLLRKVAKLTDVLVVLPRAFNQMWTVCPA